VHAHGAIALQFEAETLGQFGRAVGRLAHVGVR
jgi:hypothetical protein